MMHQKISTRKFSVYKSLFAPHRHAGRQAAQPHSFLTVALNGGHESTSRSGCFTPQERDPNTHQVSPRAGLHVLEEQKFSCFTQELNPKSSSRQPSHYSTWAITNSSKASNQKQIMKPEGCITCSSHVTASPGIHSNEKQQFCKANWRNFLHTTFYHSFLLILWHPMWYAFIGTLLPSFLKHRQFSAVIYVDLIHLLTVSHTKTTVISFSQSFLTCHVVCILHCISCNLKVH